MLRHSAMNDLAIRTEIKHEVYSIAEQIAGPLVQRVSKQVFAVKCTPGGRHPLGYLHIAFMEQRTREGGTEHRFFCSCDTFRGEGGAGAMSCLPQWTAMDREREQEWVLRRCVHFYSALCAFASDPKLSEEFRQYIGLDRQVQERAAQQGRLSNNQVIAILGQDENGDTVQVEVLNQGELRQGVELEQAVLHTVTEDIQIEMETPDGSVQTITVPAASLPAAPRSAGGNKRLLGRSSGGQGRARAAGTRAPGEPVDEGQVHLSFHGWLGSVTERINQTMHYQFDGHPEPLVFHAPQVFFDCLRERISLGSRKKRLPNSTTAFVRKDALPLGTFTKYTWAIVSILHVKQIFDTPQLALEVTRSFLENKDGSYSVGGGVEEQYTTVPGKARIRAHQLKTFLKVGQTLPDQKELTPFVIEWIPDILPSMRIGELRIKFEYGHQRNGQLEQRLQLQGRPAGQEALYRM